MRKTMEVIKEHKCKPLNNQHGTEIAVQKFNDGNWYWVDYKNNKNVMNGVLYCPYCGKELKKED